MKKVVSLNLWTVKTVLEEFEEGDYIVRNGLLYRVEYIEDESLVCTKLFSEGHTRIPFSELTGLKVTESKEN